MAWLCVVDWWRYPVQQDRVGRIQSRWCTGAVHWFECIGDASWIDWTILLDTIKQEVWLEASVSSRHNVIDIFLEASSLLDCDHMSLLLTARSLQCCNVTVRQIHCFQSPSEILLHKFWDKTSLILNSRAMQGLLIPPARLKWPMWRISFRKWFHQFNGNYTLIF